MVLAIIYFVKGFDLAVSAHGVGNVLTDLFVNHEGVYYIHGGYILAMSLLFIYFFLVVYSFYIEMNHQLAARLQPSQQPAFLGAVYPPGHINQGKTSPPCKTSNCRVFEILEVPRLLPPKDHILIETAGDLGCRFLGSSIISSNLL